MRKVGSTSNYLYCTSYNTGSFDVSYGKKAIGPDVRIHIAVLFGVHRFASFSVLICECATFKFLSPSLSERCSYSITEIVLLVSFCYYYFSFRASSHRCMYPSSYINLSSPL